MNRTSMLKQFAQKSVFSVVITAIFSTAVNAEVVVKRLSCESDSSTRIIDLVYESTIHELPCLIREQKQGEQPKTLWRARYQANFCHEQIETYRDSLREAGLQCEWLAADDNLPLVSEWPSSQLFANRPDAPPQRNSSDAVSWPTNSLNDNGKNLKKNSENIGNIQKQRQLKNTIKLTEEGSLIRNYLGKDYRNNTDEFSPLYNTTDEPFDKFSNFPESEASLDNWVIYLNGKSLAGIKELLASEPAVFEDYLNFERRHVNSIYNQLQLRIYHLTEIAKFQQQEKGASLDLVKINTDSNLP